MRIWLALAALAAVGGLAAAWLWWPKPPPAPRARQYLNVSACLLTDPRGVVPGTPAAPVWEAMENASVASRAVMVSYLPATGPADVTPMLSTLIQRQCGVIVTTGAAASQVIEAAKANPHQRFLLVTTAGAAMPTAPANATVVSPAAAAARIKQALQALAAQA